MSHQTGWLAQLAFGRDIDGAQQVSEAEFQTFVRDEISPRFPEGLTLMDAWGQWRGADGRIITEPSKILLLALPPGGEALRKVEAVRSAYRRRFRQESVMMIVQPVCTSF